MTVRSVLYVVAFAFPGITGTPLHAMGMAKVMYERGLDVRVAQLRAHPLWKNEKDVWDGIPVYRIARPGWSWKLRQLLRNLHPDIVHAHHIAAAVFSLSPCEAIGIPLVYECHSFWREEIAEAGGRLSPIQRYVSGKEDTVFKSCDHIIALSEKMKSVHIVEKSVDASKFSVVFPGVKPDWIESHHFIPADVPGVGPQDFIVMYSGNFARYQGLDLLLGGLSNVLEVVPQIKVVLVGAKADENEAKRKKWGNLNGRVIYLGRFPHEEMPSLFARADALVIPRPDSRICWTMPRKFGEYLSAGRPLLVTDVGDHRRVVEHFHCGIVTDCSSEGIADGLVRLAKLPDGELKIMGRNALRAAREWFDWGKQMDHVREIYENLNSQR